MPLRGNADQLAPLLMKHSKPESTPSSSPVPPIFKPVHSPRSVVWSLYPMARGGTPAADWVSLCGSLHLSPLLCPLISRLCLRMSFLCFLPSDVCSNLATLSAVPWTAAWPSPGSPSGSPPKVRSEDLHFHQTPRWFECTSDFEKYCTRTVVFPTEFLRGLQELIFK